MRLFKRLKLALITAAVSVGAPAALSINVSDSVGLAEDVAPQIQVYEAVVDDDIGIVDDISIDIPALEINVADTVGVAEDVTPQITPYEVVLDDDVGLDESTSVAPTFEIAVDDDIGLDESISLELTLEITVDDGIGLSEDVAVTELFALEVNVSDGIGLADADFSAASYWFGVTSTHYDSHCGENPGSTLADALDGTDYWAHNANEDHWFIVDLGAEYNIQKVRGRSDMGSDPIDVNIYINSTGSAPWGAAVASGITTWQDTIPWVEVDTTNKTGRYIRVEIVDTEHGTRDLTFGESVPFTIFDVLIAPLDILEVHETDGVGVVDSAEAFTAYLAALDDDIGIADKVSVEIPILEVSVNDGVGVITATTPLFNFFIINVADTLGVITSTTLKQAHGIAASDGIGVDDYSLLQIQILEIYTDDDVGIVDWRLHNIPDYLPTRIADLFRFPHIPVDIDAGMREFLLELESALRFALTGDSYTSGIVHAGSNLIVNGDIQLHGGDDSTKWSIGNDIGTDAFIIRTGVATDDKFAITSAGDWVINKTSGIGIRVDLAAPTYGWRDLKGKITNSKGATKPSEVTYRDGITQFQFSAGDDAELEYHIPHDYVPGTDIHLHVHWSHNSGAVTGGSIILTYEITYCKGHNQAAFPATVTGTITGIASAVQYRHIISEGQISASAPEAGVQIDTDDLEPDGLLLCRVEMTTNNMTGATPSPFFHEIDIHYQSTNLATKQKAPDFYV